MGNEKQDPNNPNRSNQQQGAGQAGGRQQGQNEAGQQDRQQGGGQQSNKQQGGQPGSNRQQEQQGGKPGERQATKEGGMSDDDIDAPGKDAGQIGNQDRERGGQGGARKP